MLKQNLKDLAAQDNIQCWKETLWPASIFQLYIPALRDLTWSLFVLRWMLYLFFLCCKTHPNVTVYTSNDVKLSELKPPFLNRFTSLCHDFNCAIILSSSASHYAVKKSLWWPFYWRNFVTTSILCLRVYYHIMSKSKYDIQGISKPPGRLL